MTSEGQDEQDVPTTDATVKVRRDGRVVATAAITTQDGPHGTARVFLGTPHTDAARQARGELVDEVLDHPGVRDSDRVRVVLPLGDSEAVGRLQERTTNLDARAAGASSIVEAEVPRADTAG